MDGQLLYIHSSSMWKSQSQSQSQVSLPRREQKQQQEQQQQQQAHAFLHDSIALGNYEEGLLLSETHVPPQEKKEVITASIVVMDEEDTTTNVTTNIQEEQQQHKHKQQQAEVERLPLLLRVLSKCRPLAAHDNTVSLTKSFQQQHGTTIDEKKIKRNSKKDEDENDDDNDNDNDDDNDVVDEVLEAAIRRLEDRAAVYSVSEGVEVVACHLSPFVCRKISKLPPCRRRRHCRNPSSSTTTTTTNSEKGTSNLPPPSSSSSSSNRSSSGSTSRSRGHYLPWDTSELTAVALNPASSRFQQQSSSNNKRRKGKSGEAVGAMTTTQTMGTDADDDDLSKAEDNENDNDDENDNNNNNNNNNSDMERTVGQHLKRKRPQQKLKVRDSIRLALGAAEDSLESFVTKTLSELALLVVQYLEHENKVFAATAATAAASAQSLVIGSEGSGNGGNTTTKTIDATVSGTVATTTTSTSSFSPSSPSSSSSSINRMTMISMEESILAQTRVVSETTSVGGVSGTDLGATCAALFHYAPILCHIHAAAALCWAEQPQTSHLLRRWGANCPASIPSLVRGCLHVATAVDATAVGGGSSSGGGGGEWTATTTTNNNNNTEASGQVPSDNNNRNNNNINNKAFARRRQLARESILELSKLSNRERQRIGTTLQCTTATMMTTTNSSSSSVLFLLEMHLELKLQHGDPVDLACFLIQHLSKFPIPTTNKNQYHHDKNHHHDQEPTMEQEKVDPAQQQDHPGGNSTTTTTTTTAVGDPSKPHPLPPPKDQNDDNNKDNNNNNNNETRKPCLADEIAQNPKTWIPRILYVLFQGLQPVDSTSSTSRGGSQRHWGGKSCLLLRACLWLVLTQESKTWKDAMMENITMSTSSRQHQSFLFDFALSLITGTRDGTCHIEESLYCLLFSCLIFVGSHYLAQKKDQEQQQQDNESMSSCDSAATIISNLWKVVACNNTNNNQKAMSFSAGVVSALQTTSPEPKCRVFVLQFLMMSGPVAVAAANEQRQEAIVAAYTTRFLGDETTLRQWWSTANQHHLDLSSIVKTVLDNDSNKVVENDPFSVIATIIHSQSSQSNLVSTKEKLEQFVMKLLMNPRPSISESDYYYQLLRDNRTVNLITSTVTYLNDLVEETGRPLIPIVHALNIEMQATIFVKKRPTMDKMDLESAIFFLKLVYCFAFREASPTNSFAFNPRVMPLRQVWLLCDSSIHDVQRTNTTTTTRMISPNLGEYLLDQIDKVAPDVKQLARFHKRLDESWHHHWWSEEEDWNNDNMKDLLRSSITNHHENDPSGARAEQLFIKAFLNCSDQDLACTVASAFLSKPKSPVLYMTYPKLYEDPLVLLKCSMKEFWMRPGLKRIALFVMTMLLNTNSTHLLQISNRLGNDETSSQELIAARDIVTVRCLMSSAVGTYSSENDCFAAIGLVRWIVCNHKGLVACLYRQGLSPEELDWLVSRVPEIFSDSSDFANLLSDTNSSSSLTERLAVADGVVRTIVLYGQRNESQSEALMLGSLSTLIAGFFVVLGPSGVSVSTLFAGNHNGSTTSTPTVDATQLSKRAALRILRHVTGVRGYRNGLWNECVIALQKLHRMCKGEELVGGLPVAIKGSRQKGTLREIQDAVTKAMVAMGAGT